MEDSERAAISKSINRREAENQRKKRLLDFFLAELEKVFERQVNGRALSECLVSVPHEDKPNGSRELSGSDFLFVQESITVNWAATSQERDSSGMWHVRFERVVQKTKIELPEDLVDELLHDAEAASQSVVEYLWNCLNLAKTRRLPPKRK